MIPSHLVTCTCWPKWFALIQKTTLNHLNLFRKKWQAKECLYLMPNPIHIYFGRWKRTLRRWGKDINGSPVLNVGLLCGTQILPRWHKSKDLTKIMAECCTRITEQKIKLNVNRLCIDNRSQNCKDIENSSRWPDLVAYRYSPWEMKSRKIPPRPRPPRRLVAEYKDLVNRKGRCRLATILLDR